MDKVREVIEKNRKRKLVKHKKLSNNRIIEIDNCSPLEIRKLQNNLTMIADNEEIEFVYGKVKRKPALQQLHEELEQCGKRLMEYKECFEIMGKDRNSYSKTDLEATFMRMKERSHANIQSERGILKRQTHSIQTEGHFGDIKENENFRRFNYRSADKVYKEFMLYAIGRNINKYHRFLYEKLRKFEGKTA